MASTLDTITKTLLSKDTLASLGKTVGISEDDASKVLASVLPKLLEGATAQASNAKTEASFGEALESHAGNYTTNIASFFKNVDIDDGAKIVKHLLGSKETAVAKETKKSTGIDPKVVTAVMAAAAPLLMSVIGNKAKKEQKKDSTVASVAKAVLGSVDVGSLVNAFIKAKL